ncbi:immunoglobulin superfamily member 5 [Bufo gargarizans]|uniref:immunoglobulin superfamily member 5 n=1 Tax=Bufo gargarizans TaxID=30331 RepID=UPI001CF3F8F4|nr:immunoglobulin superfamily member 5 [Bufo gargarizans]XP_044143412.1 immunoglobulin superfamily member 5 [Bufo gargarizans]
MDGYRAIFIWITILCLIQDFGSCSEILEGPKNVTVLRGSNASFKCTVQELKIMSWYIHEVFAVSISPSGVTVGSDFTIILKNSTNSFSGAFTSEITIINVNKSTSGSVGCSSLSASFKDAYLSVQVNGSVQITNGSVTVTPNSTVSMICQAAQWYPAPTITWQINNTAADTLYYSTMFTTDVNDFVTAQSTFRINPEEDLSLTCLATVQTLTHPQSATANITVRERIPGGSSSLSQTDIILIAVFASLGGLLIIIVIFVVIIFCCKRRKQKKTESGYQSDAWNAPERNDNNLRTIQGDSLGERNFAYTPDPVPVRHSFGSINGSSSPYYDDSSTSTASSVKVPPQEWTDDHLKKIRHVTHV